MRVALDALGGDLAPGEQVNCALLAAKELGIEVALVGPQDLIEAELRKHAPNPRISVVHAADEIRMGEDEIVKAVRQRHDASINVAMSMVKNGEAEAVVSAGNSGAVMASAFFVLGRIRGVERPALGTVLPYNAGRVFLIDAGANSDCRPSHLLQFAQMGSVYSDKVLGVKNPRIGLLNVGEEEGKGSELAVEAYERIRDSGLNFIGNVEGVNIHKGICDVVVTDGFTGNVALKLLEGTIKELLDALREEISATAAGKLGGALIRPAARRLRTRLDPDTYGGAYLLGLRGLAVIAHGSSGRRAIANAIRLAARGAEHRVVERLAERMPERVGV